MFGNRRLTFCFQQTIITNNTGMEAVWKIEVENFPAFIVVDDKGNDFFSKWLG